MRFAIVTLGCKVNHYEGQRIRQGLLHAGHCEQPFSEPGADVYIINTCTVTHKADADGRRLIRRALGSGGRVIVTGCQAGVYPDDIRKVSREVEVVRPENLSEVLDIDLPRFISEFGSQNRAFVKVQQGCDRYCTYCIVPMARGAPVSRPWQDVVTEVRTLVAGGYHEVVLTGINIGLYRGGLTRLIQKILGHTAISRVRVSSMEPWTVEDCLIDMAAHEPRVCAHLHLPLQHGSDRVLRAMGRPYTAEAVRSLVARIRDTSPSMAIGADVIVGFPGEDERAFEESYALIEGMDITYLHVFTFSPRPGTVAASLQDRPGSGAVRQRSSFLRELSRSKRREFAASRIGSVEEVLVTGSRCGGFSGISSNYLTVTTRGDAAPGSLVKVRLVGHDGSTLQGELLG
ncbi:MAG TPA: MiaB/RimO family radical SAM methylthiotransferase [Deltaproteobacteria bacterium]|nr:MiaB/RimO family radical SAM methylthiotransferase [Deltaproteobacteria bacterium]